MTQVASEPDILEVIADLSNDEVFTPPRVARAVLDLLPDSLWSDPTVRFLDPGSKSGVFLREITRRLMVGLETAIPDEDERLHHILTEQVFGIAITELTSLMSRRTLYCSKNAAGTHAATAMDTADGHIWFQRVEHNYNNGRCRDCGASEALMESEGHDNHAYAFIHRSAWPELEKEFEMKFDVIVGNPPYQLEDAGHNASATPIYQHFVETAIDLDPRYVLMITPSRWFVGGKGLDKFRDRLLNDDRVSHIVDFPKLYEPFPLVKIRGGISYFLWDRDHHGPCTIQTMRDGEPDGPAVSRRLDEFSVLVRDNHAVGVLRKVRAYRDAQGKPEATFDERVSSRKPFGWPTNFHGKDTDKGIKDPVKLYGSQKVSWVSRSQVPQNDEWVDDWKVLMTAVQGTSAAVETMFLSRPIIAGPGEACTETYLVAARAQTEAEAARYAAFLRTRLVRFLVSLRKATQHATRDVYCFVPDVPMDRDWTDVDLYARYGIDADEQAYIESVVKEMEP